jgi:hypothetical protein
VGEGETVKKAKTTPDAGGKSVSEKEEWCWKQELTTVPTLGPHGQVPDCDCQLIA